jgi:hypothetical protein
MKRDRRKRLVAALLVGCARGVVSWFGAWDFKAWWLAARAVVQGSDPYVIVGRVFRSGVLDPLPTALAAIPLVWLRPTIAGSIFAGVPSAVLAFTVTRAAWRTPYLLEWIIPRRRAHGGLVTVRACACEGRCLQAQSRTRRSCFSSGVEARGDDGRRRCRQSYCHADVAGEWIETPRASPMHFARWRVTGGASLLLAFLRRPERDSLAS